MEESLFLHQTKRTHASKENRPPSEKNELSTCYKLEKNLYGFPEFGPRRKTEVTRVKNKISKKH